MVRLIGGRRTVRGFTMVELMVSVSIVAVLSATTTTMYRQHVRKALAAEGMALVGAIRTCERIYYSEHGHYTANWDEFAANFDLKNFKFFNKPPTLTLTRAGQGFVAVVEGSDRAAGIRVSIDEQGDIQVIY